MRGIRVLIVEDHRFVLEMLQLRLERRDEIIVVGGVPSMNAAKAAVGSFGPDVALVDIGLPDGDGIALTSWIREHHPDTAVVVLTAVEDGRVAVQALRAGALGFMTKSAAFESVVRAIVGAHDGETWISPRLLTDVLRAFEESTLAKGEYEERIGVLTRREREVLEQMVAGFNRQCISRELYMSLNTVRTHTKNILAKLGVHTSLEAVSLALRAGMRGPEVESVTAQG